MLRCTLARAVEVFTGRLALTDEQRTNLQKAVVPIGAAIAAAGIVLLCWWRIVDAIETSIRHHIEPLVVEVRHIKSDLDRHEDISYHQGVHAYVDNRVGRVTQRLDRIEDKIDDLRNRVPAPKTR